MRFLRYMKYARLVLAVLALIGLALIVMNISPAVNTAVLCVWGLEIVVLIADHMLKLPQRRIEAQLIEEEESRRHSS